MILYMIFQYGSKLVLIQRTLIGFEAILEKILLFDLTRNKEQILLILLMIAKKSVCITSQNVLVATFCA